MKLNKLGLAGLVIMQGIGGFMFLTVAMATVETYNNGTLKNNGKVIWCKMMNKGEQFCNDKYGYVPSK